MRWLTIMFAACGGGSSSAPPPVKAPPPNVEVPATQMVARVAYAGTNAWFDIAIDGIGDNARGWCTELVKRFEQQRMGTLTIVVERACETTLLPPPRRRGFTISVAEPLDPLEVAMIGAGSAPEPPTGIITRVTQFDTRAACERERERIAHDEVVGNAGASAARQLVIDSELAVVEPRAKQTCDEVAAIKKAKPCRPNDTACLDDHRFEDRRCDLEQQTVRALKERRDVVTPVTEPPLCVELAG